jgi:hypothetical protein
MNEQQTCGKGLAENSTLPAALAELVASTARVLEVHMKALDPSEPNGKRELDAYRELASTHRRIANELSTLAEHMASFRDLPMASHDMSVMTSPAPRHAFAGLVRQEERVVELLQTRLERDHAMLAQMGG